MPLAPHLPYRLPRLSESELQEKSEAMLTEARKRRSCRHFSTQPVPRRVMENLIKLAATAPSGANKEPWSFAAVSDAELKRKIREAAEAEEKKFYEQRAPESWLKDLEPLGTHWQKPFLEEAPWLLVVFKQLYRSAPEGNKRKHYYVNESVGIAAGFLIGAIHRLGLATLTHTPSPMDFLAELLQRPPEEKAFLLLPVGYPAEHAEVPVLAKKEFGEYAYFYD